MRPKPIHHAKAFTLIELIMVIMILFVVIFMLFPGIRNRRTPAPRITCVSMLKELGVAYRIWSNDHNDRFPASDSMTDGGMEGITDERKSRIPVLDELCDHGRRIGATAKATPVSIG